MVAQKTPEPFPLTFSPFPFSLFLSFYYEGDEGGRRGRKAERSTSEKKDREAEKCFLAKITPNSDLPIALAKWYDYTKWVLDRVGCFPKNQRFVLGTRLADASLEVMEVLAEAAYARGSEKANLLVRANRRIESVRWLVRICKDRNLLSTAQWVFSSRALEECGRMVGGWWVDGSNRQLAGRARHLLRPRAQSTRHEAAQGALGEGCRHRKRRRGGEGDDARQAG